VSLTDGQFWAIWDLYGKTRYQAEGGEAGKKNFYHEERLFLASYMNVDGWDAEGAIEPLFKNEPDYDPQTTHQQVAQIVRKGYEPTGCHKLKAMGMCPRGCGRKKPAETHVSASQRCSR